MKKTILASAIATTLYASSAIAGGVYVVKNNHDSGAGSLRAALASGKSKIIIPERVRNIRITSTLDYSSEEAVSIFGSGQKISTDLNVTLFAATQGADVSIKNLRFVGPGNFSINSRGDIGQDAGKGIFVDVRDDQQGEVNLNLSNVKVRGVANHGIHVSDCTLADDCGGGGGGAGDGSPASINVTLNNVVVNDAGNGRFDADGLRVDERSEGDINVVIHNSQFKNVGADGAELDEGGEGDVNSMVSNTRFVDNGGYCHPDILQPILDLVLANAGLEDSEGEFDEADEVPESAIPRVFDGPDDRCFEVEVDTYKGTDFVEEYEIGIDVDDAFDIDEAGNGSINSRMVNSLIKGNLDEGADFDEEDEGDINAIYISTVASNNTDDGFKHSEEGEGSVFGTVRASKAIDNGGKGFVFEEEDEGDVEVSIRGSKTTNNDDSDDTGVEVVEEDDGSCSLSIKGSNIKDGVDDKDCEPEETE